MSVAPEPEYVPEIPPGSYRATCAYCKTAVISHPSILIATEVDEPDQEHSIGRCYTVYREQVRALVTDLVCVIPEAHAKQQAERDEDWIDRVLTLARTFLKRRYV